MSEQLNIAIDFLVNILKDGMATPAEQVGAANAILDITQASKKQEETPQFFLGRHQLPDESGYERLMVLR